MRMFIIIFSCCIAIILLLVIPGTAGADDESALSTVELDLENSLIIREIEMGSDPYKGQGDTGTGLIIHDNDFDARMYQKAGKPKGKPKKQHTSRHQILSQLQRKDSRWHVTEYIIKKNDNLWTIARNYDVDHRLIIRFNSLSHPDLIKPGISLSVPNRKGVFYHIKRGDSIYNISKTYGVSSQKIIDHNRLEPRRLMVGRRIFIPDATQLRKRFSHGRAMISVDDKKVVKKRFLWPLKGRITSAFGERKDPFTGKRSFHCGIDISAHEGTRVKSSAAGKVIFSGWKTGYGNVVIIRHNNNYITVYAHNRKNIVKQGDRVDSGELIALSGKTGAVTGAHLHFEIRKYVTPLNPMRFL